MTDNIISPTGKIHRNNLWSDEGGMNYPKCGNVPFEIRMDMFATTFWEVTTKPVTCKTCLNMIEREAKRELLYVE